VYAFDRAKVILALDADFLLHDRDAVRHALGFSAGRRKPEAMNRLYVAASSLSVTGIAADHRLSIQSGRIPAFTAALAAELGAGKAPDAKDLDRKWLAAVAKDLKANAGSSLIVAGAGQPAAVHAAVAALNASLGNVGKTVSYVETKETERSSTEDLRQLAADMKAGKVETLVVLGGNPVYDAPADFELGAALAKVKSRIRLGLYIDETSAACDWHLPEAHFLESWGDVRSVGGPLSVVQPLIEPLFGGKSSIELLALVTDGEEKTGHELVQETWKKILPGDFEKGWERVLHDGLLAGSELPAASPRMSPKPIADLSESSAVKAAPASAQNLELVFRPSAAAGDGRFGNVAWLQELPDPVTKLTWDNAALVGLETARALGIAAGDLVKIQYAKKEITAPVLVVPGQAENSIALDVGYGRTGAGRIGNGVGFDVYPLRTSDAPGFGLGARLSHTGAKHVLATTHEHWGIDDRGENLAASRSIIKEADVAAFGKHAHAAGEHEEEHHHPPLESLWDEKREHPYEKSPQWGMTIDLGSCIGCNACVIACQAENNIPVVGKDQVTRGREMHWIRIDRYFSGRPEAPDSIVFQPVPCMQCENAPCEQVCPVAATVHDEQGLNTMVYNRCIGTRYCSNNCPYKVRRFNFYNFTRDTPELLKMAQNPDVTVRARGVMEKCSYCVQRLNRARIDAKIHGTERKDGDVQTACQQSCPTRAIEFGDIRDAKSAVSLLKASERNYDLLEELNTKPRTSYLLRLKNPNPELGQA
jgi:molybdopterin-containing oxidoreductase family iron-sulfur binding subunit